MDRQASSQPATFIDASSWWHRVLRPAAQDEPSARSTAVRPRMAVRDAIARFNGRAAQTLSGFAQRFRRTTLSRARGRRCSLSQNVKESSRPQLFGRGNARNPAVESGAYKDRLKRQKVGRRRAGRTPAWVAVQALKCFLTLAWFL